MKASLQIGSKWGRTVLIPVSILHLMLGLHCLVSIMIWQMSHHLLFSAQVCSECLSVILLTHFKLVLDPTTKDSYIKHYFTPSYQVATIVNIHNIVSTYILKLGYYWMLLVSWVLWHVSHQISHTRYSQYHIMWANSQPNPCRSVWVIMPPCSKPSSLWTRDLKQWSLCRAGLLPQWSTRIPRHWYAEFLDGVTIRDTRSGNRSCDRSGDFSPTFSMFVDVCLHMFGHLTFLGGVYLDYGGTDCYRWCLTSISM